jgi:hypothetical protein
MSDAMALWFRENVVGNDSNFSRITGGINHAMVMECAAGILHRCESQLLAERRELGRTDIEDERDHLSELATGYFARSREATEATVEEARRIQHACDEMSREILVLKTTQVACKIENARYSGGAEGLDDIISQFGDLQMAIEAHLSAIQKKCVQFVKQWEDSRGKSPNTPDALLYGTEMAAALRRDRNLDQNQGGIPPTPMALEQNSTAIGAGS